MQGKLISDVQIRDQSAQISLSFLHAALFKLSAQLSIGDCLKETPRASPASGLGAAWRAWVQGLGGLGSSGGAGDRQGPCCTANAAAVKFAAALKDGESLNDAPA